MDKIDLINNTKMNPSIVSHKSYNQHVIIKTEMILPVLERQ